MQLQIAVLNIVEKNRKILQEAKASVVIALNYTSHNYSVKVIKGNCSDVVVSVIFLVLLLILCGPISGCSWKLGSRSSWMLDMTISQILEDFRLHRLQLNARNIFINCRLLCWTAGYSNENAIRLLLHMCVPTVKRKYMYNRLLSHEYKL